VSGPVVEAIKQLPLDRQMEYRAAFADEYQRDPAQHINSIDDILIVEPEEIDLPSDAPRQTVAVKPKAFVRSTHAQTVKFERAGVKSRTDVISQQRGGGSKSLPKKDDVMVASAGAPVHDDLGVSPLELDDLSTLDNAQNSRGLHA
jgi:hypothetical protein